LAGELGTLAELLRAEVFVGLLLRARWTKVCRLAMALNGHGLLRLTNTQVRQLLG
jgi:hypothetical protein